MSKIDKVHADLVKLTVNSNDMTVAQIKTEFRGILKKHKIPTMIRIGRGVKKHNPTQLMCTMTFSSMMQSKLELDLFFADRLS